MEVEPVLNEANQALYLGTDKIKMWHSFYDFMDRLVATDHQIGKRFFIVLGTVALSTV